jgi:para-nitrobenzyl esterase
MRRPVVTTAGAVAGVELSDPEVVVFRGIPYAEPPLAGHRFRPPTPVRSWQGVRPAVAFGPAAPQPQGGSLEGLVPGMTPKLVGEDCLSLTVWAPLAPSTPRPVLVWIHGGAFMIGSSSLPTYDAARLASEQGVVVVSINYRLGALGFLDLRHRGGSRLGAVPNCGLLDQLLALRWVRDNVAAFGGNPSTVTVFGESAGAGSILHLLGTPGLGRLVRRAVVQSPGIHFTLDAELADSVAAALLARLGIAETDVERLEGVPWEEVVDAQAAVVSDVVGAVGPMPFHPVVDGTSVPEPPLAALARGAGSDVDLLIGCTADEMRLFADPRSRRADRDTLVRLAGAHLGGHPGRGLGVPPARAAEVVDAYLQRSSSSEASWTGVLTDSLMRLPAMQAADAHAAHGSSTFSYLFTWEAPRLGAFHAVDLPFTFGTFDVDGWGEFVGADVDAVRLSGHLRQAWAAFARSGDPGTPGLGRWPQYRPPERRTMVLGRHSRVEADPLGTIRELWRLPSLPRPVAVADA